MKLWAGMRWPGEGERLRSNIQGSRRERSGCRRGEEAVGRKRESDHVAEGAKHGARQLVSICLVREHFISCHPPGHHVRCKSWDLNPELTPAPVAPQLSPCCLQTGELCPWIPCIWFIGVFGDSVSSETSNYPEFLGPQLLPYATM